MKHINTPVNISPGFELKEFDELPDISYRKDLENSLFLYNGDIRRVVRNDERLIVPRMSNYLDTTVGDAIASSRYNDYSRQFKAFNRCFQAAGLLDGSVNADTTDTWVSANAAALGQWIGFRFFSEKHVLTAYDVWTRPGSFERNPRTWIIQGSNDGTTWINLHEQTTTTVLDSATNRNTGKIYIPIEKQIPYLYFRLYNTWNTSSYIAVGQLCLYGYSEKDGPVSSVSLMHNKLYDYCYDLIPETTSNDATSIGQPIYSSQINANSAAFTAFNKLTTGYGWLSADGRNISEWIGYKFLNEKKYVLFKYKLATTQNWRYYYHFINPRKWKVQGSNDGSNWITIHEQNEGIDLSYVSTSGESESPWYYVPEENWQPFSQFRLIATAASSSPTLTYIGIGELYLYGISGEEYTYYKETGNFYQDPSVSNIIADKISQEKLIEYHTALGITAESKNLKDIELDMLKYNNVELLHKALKLSAMKTVNGCMLVHVQDQVSNQWEIDLSNRLYSSEFILDIRDEHEDEIIGDFILDEINKKIIITFKDELAYKGKVTVFFSSNENTLVREMPS